MAEEYFAEYGIRLEQFDIELPESRSEEGIQISREKVRIAYKKLRKPVFVMDGSLHIKALNNFPKTYVQFIDKYIGAEGILRLMEGKKNRKWEFLNVICYKDGKTEKHFVHPQKGVVIKKLDHRKKGLIRDFDRVLVPKGYEKTFAEMTKKEARDYDERIWKPGVFDKFIHWLKSRTSS